MIYGIKENNESKEFIDKQGKELLEIVSIYKKGEGPFCYHKRLGQGVIREIKPSADRENQPLVYVRFKDREISFNPKYFELFSIFE